MNAQKYDTSITIGKSRVHLPERVRESSLSAFGLQVVIFVTIEYVCQIYHAMLFTSLNFLSTAKL